MERLNTHLSSADAALQEAPKVLKPGSVDASISSLNGVFDQRKGILAGQSMVRKKEIGTKRGARFHMLLVFSLKCSSLPVRGYRTTNLAAVLKDFHYSNLVLGRSAINAALVNAQEHIAYLAADQSHISFNLTGELDGRAVMHRLANPMQHEPSRPSGDAERPSDLTGNNAALIVAEYPETTYQRVEFERRVLEDRITSRMNCLSQPLLEPKAARADNECSSHPQ